MVFNSALETGLRSVCILVAVVPRNLNIQQLLAYDHIVVHSGDILDGPSSLHPSTSQRNGELLVRRPLVTSGLMLMESKNLVVRSATNDGIKYSASDLSEVFLDSLENKYLKSLRDRANWASDKLGDFEKEVFDRVFNTVFDRWTSEFQFSEMRIGGAK